MNYNLTENQLRNVSSIFKLLSFGRLDFDSIEKTYEEASGNDLYLLADINVCDVIAAIIYIDDKQFQYLHELSLGKKIKRVCNIFDLSVNQSQLRETIETLALLKQNSTFRHKVSENELTGIVLAFMEHMQNQFVNSDQNIKGRIH